jgi:hypothetical protein
MKYLLTLCQPHMYVYNGLSQTKFLEPVYDFITTQFGVEEMQL